MTRTTWTSEPGFVTSPRGQKGPRRGLKPPDVGESSLTLRELFATRAVQSPRVFAVEHASPKPPAEGDRVPVCGFLTCIVVTTRQFRPGSDTRAEEAKWQLFAGFLALTILGDCVSALPVKRGNPVHCSS